MRDETKEPDHKAGAEALLECIKVLGELDEKDRKRVLASLHVYFEGRVRR